MITHNDIRWYETEGGESLPSVTSILKMWPKDGLVQWAANCAVDHIITESETRMFIDNDDLKAMEQGAKKAHLTMRDEAAGLGTMIHDAIEILLKGDKPENYYQHEMVLSACEAWKRFASENMIEPLAVEQTVIGDGYAGRIDLVANMNGRVTMIDFKTSKRFHDSFPMQIAAYCEAFEKTYGINISSMGVLRYDKLSGRILFKDYSPLREQALDTFKNLLKLFYSALDYWASLKEAKRAKGY